MSKALNGRMAIVTGAARGIGAATAAALAAVGAEVLAIGRTRESLGEVECRIQNAGGSVVCEAMDLSDLAAIPKLALTVDRRFGKLDILVGNAAILGERPLLRETDLADWQSVLAVNLTANMQLIRAFDPLLQRSDAPRAVFLTAGSAQHPRVTGSAYSVSKCALEGMVRIYAAENEKSSLRVNVFNPGPTRTSMRARVAPAEDPMTLDTADQVAEKIVSVCLPTVIATGQLYDYPSKRFMKFSPPVPA